MTFTMEMGAPLVPRMTSGTTIATDSSKSLRPTREMR